MSSIVYDWDRFWCPRGQPISLGDGGYAVDPDHDYSEVLQPNVLSSDKILSASCLILLGEPGVGKSSVIRSMVASQKLSLSGTNNQILFLDLRSVGSEGRLSEKLFQSQPFQQWLAGNHTLDLFLDSLDECLLRVDTVAGILADELPQFPVKRLNLRITCRTADWPGFLETRLSNMYGEANTRAYELVPLRRRDVQAAVKQRDLDPQSFLAEVDRVNGVPFAIKPVTLEFLLNTFSKNGQLPSSQLELYEQGCLMLVGETNESRLASHRAGHLTNAQRLMVAARIAYLTVFGNRYAVWSGVDQGNVPPEDVLWKKLAGGQETAIADDFDVTEEAIEETISTGLFSSRGIDRFGWAHQTYAEYLAALYLVKRKAPIPQILSLLVNAQDTERKIVPQLQETAAWLASLSSEFFREAVRTDPEVLLRSDVMAADSKDRASLTQSLLDAYDKELLVDSWQHRSNYKRLGHPGIHDQLRPYIRPQSRNIVVRRAAIDMAQECNVKELQQDLFEIVFDQSDSYHIRGEAATALVEIADDRIKEQLGPLAEGAVGDDPDDNLKACGLRAIWPLTASFDEILPLLTPPKSSVIGGAYYDFLFDLSTQVPINHLVDALKWAEGQSSRDFGPLSTLADSILRKAWDELDKPGIALALARAVLARLRDTFEVFGRNSDERTFSKNIEADAAKRRLLLRNLISASTNPDQDSLRIAFGRTRLVVHEDFLWLIDLLDTVLVGSQQAVLIRLIGRVYDIRDPKHTDAVISSANRFEPMRTEFIWVLEPIVLGTEHAARLKAEYDEAQKLQSPTPEAIKDQEDAKYMEHLEQCEAEGIAAFWRFNMGMLFNGSWQAKNGEHEPDLTSTPTWKKADEVLKSRILRAAEQYVLKENAHPQEWLDKDTRWRPAEAGYRAIRLLLKEERGTVESFNEEVWRNWSPALIAFDPMGARDDKALDKELVSLAFRHAPKEAVEALSVLIDHETQDYSLVLQRVEQCWTDDIASLVLDKATRDGITPQRMGILLEPLIKRGIPQAVKFAADLVSSATHSPTADRAVVAGRVLLKYSKVGWQFAWPVIRDNPEYGKAVLEGVDGGSGLEGKGFMAELAEADLAELARWLFHQYPVPDSRTVGSGAMTGQFRVELSRDAAYEALKIRGTYSACDQLQRIANEFPQYSWMKWHLREALELARRQTWKAPLPDHLMRLVGDKVSRFVANGSQLLDVIVESLHALELKLHDEYLAVQDLWNEIDERFRPVEEEGLSDYIARHFRENLATRGVVANREVVIRRKQGDGRPGERTDIHIDAISEDENSNYDVVTVILEAKGCWNTGIDTAMEEQLVGRYLTDNRCKHGVYVIGWFHCAQWDTSDARFKMASPADLPLARHKFEDQAIEVSARAQKVVRAFILDAALR